MGVDAVIYLPPYVDDDDVCEMMAICAGARAYRRDFGQGHSGWSAVVDGISYRAEGHGRFPTLVQVGFSDALGRERHAYYFPRHRATGGPMIRPRSTPFWIAIGRRLIQVFGGKLNYQDSDGEINEEVDPADAQLTAEDCDEGNNEGFYKRQNALMSARALTPEELISASKVAGYPYEATAKGRPTGAEAKTELGAFKALHERLALEAATAADPETPKPARRRKKSPSL